MTSRISVRRLDPLTQRATEYSSIHAAMRVIAGTATEIRWSEASTIRAALRAGRNDIRDSRGFVWSTIGEVAPFARRAAAPALTINWEQLTFGVEIECVAPNRDAIQQALTLFEGSGITGWRATHDGSINADTATASGVEFVSPILRGEEGLAAIQTVCRILNSLEFRVNRSCGLHVHVGARELSIAQIGRVASSFVRNESHFDALVPRSRRENNNRYCQSVVGRSIPVSPRGIRSIAAALNGGYEPNRHYTSRRYHKLNLQPYARLGTMEFRQHSGTTDGKKIESWVRLVTGFVAAASNGALPEPASFDVFLSACVPAETANWLRERSQDLAAA